MSAKKKPVFVFDERSYETGPSALPAGSELAPALLFNDPTDDPAYQAFVESMVKHCHCRANNCPCDGVLAGGPCDMVQEEEPERAYDEDE